MALPDDLLSFPDEPRGQLDKTLSDLVEQAGQVLQTQGRLRALLRANQAVVEHLELPVVLRRIVEAAVELVGAHYGALGVISPAGGLEEFINVGIDPELAHRIGHLPEGHGLLGALIDDPRPIRLEHLAHDPRSVGFPAHHPPMDSFLGVPIRVRDEVFGNLYLSSREGTFSLEDEQLVTSLAATAGFAIENARLYAETARRQAWAAASAEVTAAMLSSEQDDAISILATRVLTISEADTVAIVAAASAQGFVQGRSSSDESGELLVTVARGLDAELLQGGRFAVAGTLAESVFEGGQPILVNDGSGAIAPLSEGELGPVMALPIVSGGVTEGVLLVGRLAGRPRFVGADLEMAADFAGQASVALELIKAKTVQQSMLLADDRSRIARDLHDHVIQQLFGTGLELQGLAAAQPTPALGQRVTDAIIHLDGAIAQIRTVIFALTPVTAATREGIRHRLIALATEITGSHAQAPSVSFTGPVDLAVDAELAADVMAVAREALTNVGKHARAGHTALRLAVTDDTVVLEIEDDGVGIGGDRRSGLANLDARATRRGGSLDIETSSAGTRLRWSVPLA